MEMCNDKESEREESEQQQCNYCHELSASYDGPSNSDVYLNCHCPHFFCTNCINDFFDYEIVLCPICHFLFAKWLYTRMIYDEEI
jgi:hypothetical protein